MSKKSAGAFIGGLLVGGVIGTVTGLLIAPRTGRDTRQLLKKSADALPDLAEDLSTTVQLQADRLSESALRNWDGTLGRLREAIAAGIEASAREKIELKQSQSDLATESHPSVPDHQL
ncbi:MULTISPECIES: YtxH domain-containing protein [unclassified Coleofasciculus]|uniref:YtxH domain-containing protein n=1 Tax=unclassified Coleofasciculus TaxID=2692782 RepID=UPI001882F06C|nr:MULTISPECIES: YtxH domain-containing protein [unclassified Coleofasciculus]MBE9125592.1 YtxH domain-containing protein [Coleofasciculus sp. LEGE 07081]MBE9147306.1 YtxH domain-containing protein [Coleofasciculus sp. LEGE 07092]